MTSGVYHRDRTIHSRYCVNGHDTFVVGRNPSNRRCKACKREYDVDAQRLAQGLPILRNGMEMVPATRIRNLTTREDAPLAWAAQFRTGRAAASRAAWRLYNKHRISVDSADRWCIALGTTLAVVYPELYR